MNVVNLIIFIIENPNIEKGYRDLKNYYNSKEMTNEALAIEDLIRERFNGHHNASIGAKSQPSN